MFTILLLLSMLSVNSQEQKVYFDDVITAHIKQYNRQCDSAIYRNNRDYVDVLFDSLTKTYLKGTLISKLKLKKISGGYIETDDIKKPILLITKKTCIVTHREEIKAINDMANHYHGKLEIVVLYWDPKRLVKKSTKGYNKNVHIVYVNERDNKLDVTMGSLKNSFGVPASFYITSNKELNHIDRKFYLKNLKRDTKKEFYDHTYKDITNLLMANETNKMESVISITDD